MEIIDINGEVIQELSPYDMGYPIQLLSQGLKRTIAQAEDVADTIFKVVAKEAPMVAQAKEAMKKGCRYVMDVSEEVLEDLDTGKIKLSVEKGKMTAQIREANGRYGSKFGIKKENFRKGLDPVQLANALQMKALEEQIEQIAYQINSIDRNVHSVLQGQQNDRIGLYYSGLALYLEAKSVSDETLKKQLMIQALRTLSESSFQLTLTMQSDIKFLADKEYDNDRKQRVKLIDEHMTNINKSFQFVHQASLLRAAIYCEQGEVGAMATVLSEYSKLLETTIAQNANLLAECDTNDNATEDGIWKKRAGLKLDVAELTKQLTSPDKTVYLGLTEEEAL